MQAPGWIRVWGGVAVMASGAWGLGFRVLSLGFRALSLGFRALSLGFRALSLGYRALSLRFIGVRV